MFKISFAIIPRTIGHGPIRLRRLSIADVAPFTRRFEKPPISEGRHPALLSYLLTWYWFKKNYPLAYCILLHGNIVGFIGVSAFVPKETGEISLVIFDEEMRHKGIGTTAFKLLKEDIRRRRLLKTLYAMVKQGNRSGMKFWKKMGFINPGQYREQAARKDRYPPSPRKQCPGTGETIRLVLRL